MYVIELRINNELIEIPRDVKLLSYHQIDETFNIHMLSYTSKPQAHEINPNGKHRKRGQGVLSCVVLPEECYLQDGLSGM